MSEPSWLPSTWPSWAPKIEDHYKALAPRQWPRGLYSEQSNARKDQTAIGHLFSWVRKMSWWFMRTYFPQYDDQDYQLRDWEDDFALGHTGTLTERANRILASWRNRGTTTLSKIKAIFGPIFDTTDPTDISVIMPTPSATWAASICWDPLPWPYAQDLDINGMGGASRYAVYAVGDSGAIYRWGIGIGGSKWVVQTSGTAVNLEAVWAPVGDNAFAWAVGVGGAIREWNGDTLTWTAGPVGGPSDDLYCVSGTPQKRYSSTHGRALPKEVWVGGTNGRISHWDGSWTNEVVGGGGDIWISLHAYAVDDIWAGADTGKVAHWDGTSWTTWTPAAYNWYGIRKTQPSGTVYVAGKSGKCWKYAGSSWSEISTGTAEDLFAMDGWAEDRLIAVGSNGICLRGIYSSGTAWREVHTPVWEAQYGLWVAENSVYAFSGGLNGQTMVSPDGAAAEYFARNQGALHIYSTNLDLDPDYGIGRAKCELCKPVQQFWTLGRRLYCRASDSGGQSGASNSCAS